MGSEKPRHKTKPPSFLDRIRTNEVVTGLTLSIIVGAVAGLGAVGFRWLIGAVQNLFFSNGANYLGFMGQYYIILLPAVGGLIVGLLVRYGAREAKGHGVPVVNEQGEFVGVVTIADVEAAMTKGSPATLTVKDIASRSVVVAYPDEYIHDVFMKLGSRDVGRVPVVERRNPKRLLGVLRRHDVLTAYSKTIMRKPRQ